MENASSGEKQVRWEATVDFQKVPAGDSVDIIYEHLSPGEFLRQDGWFDDARFRRPGGYGRSDPVAAYCRKGKSTATFRLIRYETGKPGTAENVKLVTEYLAEDSTILAFKLLSLKAGYTYEITWYYR